MSTRSTLNPDRRDAVALGAFLIAAGVGLALHRAGTIDGAAVLRDWWPLALVVAGIWRALTHGGVAIGVALVAVGLALLAVVRTDTDVSVAALIGPAVLVVIGVGALSAARRLHQVEWRTDGGAPRTIAVFGDARATVGEDALDLPHVTRPVVSVFGDVHLDVPAGWRIDDHVSNVLGSVKVPRDQPDYPEAPTLAIHGVAIFGDVRARYIDTSEVGR